jgi:cell wall-associated NlpC family hydrolase
MRLRLSNASPIAKTTLALVIVASLSGIAVGVATQTGGAATKAAAKQADAKASSAPKSAAGHAATASATVTATPAATAASATGNAIVAAAASQSGMPYCYGGGGINGPSEETNNSSSPGCAPPLVGFDCMSLAQYAVYQGTGHQVVLPDNGGQPTSGTFIEPTGTEVSDVSSLLPGDAVFFGGTIGDYDHSGIYAGNGEVWDALDNGIPVQEHEFSAIYSDYGNVYDGAYRFTAAVTPPPPPPALSITTASLHNGTIYKVTHKSYSATLHATAGTPPYAWSLAAGSKHLPTGLKLGANGVISGKATTKGTFSFTVRAADAGSPKEAAKKVLSIKIT